MAIRMTRALVIEAIQRYNRNPAAAPTAALNKILPYVAEIDPRTASAMRATIASRAV